MDKKTARKLRICKYLEEGMWFKDACVASGITEQTGHRYKREDVSFVSQCEASLSKYHLKLVRSVNQAALKNGWIALEVLKIRWPEQWNTKKVQIFDPQEEIKRVKQIISAGESKRTNNRLFQETAIK